MVPAANTSTRTTLNIAGKKYQVSWKILDRFPETRLGRLSAAESDAGRSLLCDEFDNEEFYFDRHSLTFDSILTYYQTGNLHFPPVCFQIFCEELTYWEIDTVDIAPCCAQKFFEQREQYTDRLKRQLAFANHYQPDEGRRTIWSYLWKSLDTPWSTWAGTVFALFNICILLVSLIGLMLNTDPRFQECSQAKENPILCEQYPNRNLIVNEVHIESGDRKMTQDELWITNRRFGQLEGFCLFWFLLEYILRFLLSPRRRTFVVEPLSIIDLLVIIQMLVLRALAYEPRSAFYFTVVTFPVVRVLKFARYSIGFRAVGLTLKKSYKELGTVLGLLGTCACIFGSTIHYAEVEENDDYRTILVSFWWAVVSMTTVGYGDVYPKTVMGKIIAMICCTAGFLIVALPLPVIYKNFTKIYNIMREEGEADFQKAVKQPPKQNVTLPTQSSRDGQANLGVSDGQTSV